MMTRDFDGISFQWPAVCVAIGGIRHEATSDHYEDDDLTMDISVEKIDGVWHKRLSVRAKHPLPTPDYVEMDSQTVPDASLRLCGYLDTAGQALRATASEEGNGVIPGCGYPLIGSRLFVGLAHQAGFARIVSQDGQSTTYTLRHHPVWEGDLLGSIEEVFGVSDDPTRIFDEYIDRNRLPLPLQPFFAFCSFWSDPYLGDYEYAVTGEAMTKFIAAYRKLGFSPDVFTFDAGWHNRQSFFEPKAGLEFEKYPQLSLWVSHNGPMGIAPEFLRREGIAVGGGQSAAYSGDNSGVLLDPKLEAALTKRFCELARSCRHLKIDWDNDCATSPEFAEKYPTQDHVREGSINAMNRILSAVRRVNPSILVRNGWWSSPWWLLHATHVFLAQSGDSEYTSLPTLHQRAAAATHRDLMYYNHLQRDCSRIPLSSFDNHEFPHSIRNAFTDTAATWTDNLMLCLLRGSTYFTWTVQPESLSPECAAAMKSAMRFARAYPSELFVRHGRMIGGNPGLGEVYGFLQPGEGDGTDSWCVLRNPAPTPQRFALPAELGHAMQFYPDFRQLDGEILLLPEEVKCVIFSHTRKSLPFAEPFQVEKTADGYAYRFPSTKSISETVRPMVAELHQIPALHFENTEYSEDGRSLFFDLVAPYRMHELRICLKIDGEKAGSALPLRAYSSRYHGRQEHSTFAVPVTELPAGKGGYGEQKNPATIYRKHDRYFTFAVPSGGSTSYELEFAAPIPRDAVDLWCVGYEDRSAEALIRTAPPSGFERELPLRHPDGFPCAVELVVGS